MTEKREDGGSRPRRRSRSRSTASATCEVAEGNGPVNALDTRPARRDRRPLPAPGRHRADQLQGADPRRGHGTGAVTRVLLDSSDGEREWGTIGVSENIIEASWEALVDSLEYAFQPRGDAGASDHPARRGRRSAPARRSWCSRCCAPAGSRWARWASASSASFADWLGVDDAVAVSSGTAALHLGVRALGWGAGRRGPDQPLQLRRLRQLPALRGRAAGLLRRRPGDAQHRPGGRRGGRGRAHGRDPARPHLRLPGRDGPRSRRSPPSAASAILEDACEALGAVDAEGRRVGARGNLATFAFYANKQMTTGEGGMLVPGDPAVAAPCCAASATRAARPTWAGSTTAGLGFNYRLSDLAAALGVAQLERLDDDARPPRARRRALRARACAGVEGVELPIAGTAATSGAAGSSTSVRLAERGRPRRGDRPLAERGIASKAYLPCIHLFPHLRELGYREGQFPVAEDASARSLALPFFPAMTESQVDAGVRGSRPNPIALMSRFRKDPDPRFWRLNRSIEFDWRLAPYDIDQSQAHARGLREIGVLDEAELEQIDAGLERVGARMGEHGFQFDDGRRGHPHGDRAPARRGDRPARRQAAHRRARATTRSRPTWRWSCRRTRCGRSSWPGRRWSACSSWPSATATGRCPATPTCSAPSRSTSAITCSPTSGCSPATCCASSSRSTAPAVMPLGSGALAGVNWEIDRRAVADDLGFDARQPQLDRRRLQPRLRARLPRRGLDLRDAPLAARLGDRASGPAASSASASSTSPSPRARRSCRRRRTPTRPSCCGPRAPRVAADYLLAAGHDARPAADLRQGHAGGQGAALRRDRHGRVLPRRGRGDAGGDRVRPRAPRGGLRRRDAGRDRGRRPARRARACRSARRTASSAAWSATRSSAASALSELSEEELRQRSEHLDGSFYEVLRRESWLESKRIEGGTGSAAARRRRSSWPTRPSPRSRQRAREERCERRAGAERPDRAPGRRLLRPLGARRRPRPDRLPALLRGLRRHRSSRPRATSATTPPATPTSA